MRASHLVIAAALIASSGCGGAATRGAANPAAAEPRTMSLAELAERVRARDGRTFIFDANPQDMYLERHVPGAGWVPYDGVTADVLPPDRAATVVFYCANPQCSASPHAARTAMALGFTNVYVMPEGIFGWVDAGLPVEP